MSANRSLELEIQNCIEESSKIDVAMVSTASLWKSPRRYVINLHSKLESVRVSEIQWEPTESQILSQIQI